jgi:hypothetical protein
VPVPTGRTSAQAAGDRRRRYAWSAVTRAPAAESRPVDQSVIVAGHAALASAPIAARAGPQPRAGRKGRSATLATPPRCVASAPAPVAGAVGAWSPRRARPRTPAPPVRVLDQPGMSAPAAVPKTSSTPAATAPAALWCGAPTSYSLTPAAQCRPHLPRCAMRSLRPALRALR